MTSSRRAVLLGGAATVLSACGARRLLGSDNVADPQLDGSFRSAHLRRRVGWSVAYPRDHAPGDTLPVVVSLHGRGADHRTAFSSLRLADHLDAVVAAGTRPFAVASVDGGDHSYWHRRANGTDASAMVVEELLPVLESKGLRTDVLGLHGWSMGGYGALLMAGRSGLRLRAVAVASPALFTSAGATAPGAFDDAADFEAHDVYAHPEWLDGVPLRIDCGDSDPFAAATRDFIGRLRTRPAGGFSSGHHDATYWRRVAPGELRFLGAHLT